MRWRHARCIDEETQTAGAGLDAGQDSLAAGIDPLPLQARGANPHVLQVFGEQHTVGDFNQRLFHLDSPA